MSYVTCTECGRYLIGKARRFYFDFRIREYHDGYIPLGSRSADRAPFGPCCSRKVKARAAILANCKTRHGELDLLELKDPDENGYGPRTKATIEMFFEYLRRRRLRDSGVEIPGDPEQEFDVFLRCYRELYQTPYGQDFLKRTGWYKEDQQSA